MSTALYRGHLIEPPLVNAFLEFIWGTVPSLLGPFIESPLLGLLMIIIFAAMSWKSRSIFAGLTALMWTGIVGWDLFNTVTFPPGTWRLDRIYIGLTSPILLLMSVISLVLFIRQLRKQARTHQVVQDSEE